jgi:hypothetical protein
VGSYPPHLVNSCFCHLSVDRNCVNSCLDGHLLKLKKFISKMTYLHYKKVKWYYYFINFILNVVVLEYVLDQKMGGDALTEPDSAHIPAAASSRSLDDQAHPPFSGCEWDVMTTNKKARMEMNLDKILEMTRIWYAITHHLLWRLHRLQLPRPCATVKPPRLHWQSSTGLGRPNSHSRLVHNAKLVLMHP